MCDIDVMDAKHYALSIDEDVKIPNETDAAIVKFVSWVMDVWSSRKYPAFDWLDQPMTGARAARAGTWIAGGYGAAFSAVEGDIKEKVKLHRFERHWGCLFPCELCLGSRHMVDNSAYDFSPDAEWLKQQVSTKDYLQVCTGEARSPWAMVRGWGLERIRFDLLHLLWLGLAKDLGGQLLFDAASDLVKDGVCGGLEAALLFLHGLCKEHYKVAAKKNIAIIRSLFVLFYR